MDLVLIIAASLFVVFFWWLLCRLEDLIDRDRREADAVWEKERSEER